MTYYEILEVSENASEEVIKMAYKALVKKYHPDVFSGDPQIAETKIKEINYAFDILSDSQKRKQYDDFLNRERQKDKTEDISKESQSKNYETRKKRAGKKWLWGIVGVVLLGIILVYVIDIKSLVDNRNTEQQQDDVFDEYSEPIIYEPIEDTGVYWLLDYRFFYYGDESRYVLLFELADEAENALSAAGEAEICIVNNNGQKVYDKTRVFTENNFENWTFDGSREVYVAAIYIEPSEIDYGNTAEGTIYFTVSGNDYSFDELSLKVYDLPYENVGETVNSPLYEETRNTCLEPLCENVVNMLGVYCEEHRCANINCIFGRQFNSPYCSTCECSEPNCKNARQYPGFYCIEHTCMQLGCYYQKKVNSNYCFLHE